MRRTEKDREEPERKRTLPRNGILYQVRKRDDCSPRLLVSEMEFDRAAVQIARGARGVRTVAFPSTVKEVRDGAFGGNERLLAVVLNEGLEELGKRQDGKSAGVFRGTSIRQVVLPSTLRALGDGTFLRCKGLRHVDFPDEGTLEVIGARCFYDCGLERARVPSGVTAIFEEAFFGSRLMEATIPKTVKTIGVNALASSKGHVFICVEDGFGCSISYASGPASASVFHPSKTTAWGRPLSELCKLREVVVPEGAERIGNQWFWGSSVVSVTIPASVREICVEAFYDCTKLK